jgi:hypothetical protein
VLCRKPLIGTVAETVLRYGTGALNIDACRYRYGDRAWPGPDASGHWGDGTRPGGFGKNGIYGTGKAVACGGHDLGRWPANVYHCPKVSRAEREAGCEHLGTQRRRGGRPRGGRAGTKSPSAGAGRTADAVHNHHPTLKPIELMAWLCRLVTQPGGVVLDPFAGSGSCGAAALQGGFRYLGAELDAEYVAIAEARIMHHAGLFGKRKATAGGVL